MGELLDNNLLTIERVSQCLTFLQGYCRAAKRRYDAISKQARHARSIYQNAGKIDNKRLSVYLEAEQVLKAEYLQAKRKLDVSIYIFEEMQLTPWNLTADYLDALVGGNSAAMELTGVGDPSGRTEAFSFVKDVTSGTSIGGGVRKQTVNIAGTETDLRKLSNERMGEMLREFGMEANAIKKLKRWDKVQMVKEMCTRAANEGSGVLTDGLERFARQGQSDPQSEQTAYEERIEHIWRRQINAMREKDGGEEDEEAKMYDNFYSDSESEGEGVVVVGDGEGEDGNSGRGEGDINSLKQPDLSSQDSHRTNEEDDDFNFEVSL